MARAVIAAIGAEFPGIFPPGVSATQIVADDVAGLSPEADGFDALLGTALSTIDAEASTAADFDGELGLMNFSEGALEGANLTPMAADYASAVAAGDGLNDAATTALTGQPVQTGTAGPPPPPQPPQSPGSSGGGGGGEEPICFMDGNGEPVPCDSPFRSTF